MPVLNLRYGSSAPTVLLTNCLLANITSVGPYYGINNQTVTSSAFVTVGAGNHYLAASTQAPIRGGGTTLINTDLRTRTTWAPQSLTS